MASRFCDQSCDTLAPSPCDHCGDNTNDTLRCSFIDNKNLCQDCFQALPNAKREDIGEPEWVCDNPCNQKVKFFCKTCHLGTCKECAGGIHEGHDVVCVMKLAEEIRRDLTEQYELVTKKADEISQQQEQFLNCIAEKNTAFEEARHKAVKTVNGLKKIIEEDLEKKVDAINEDTDKEVRKLDMLEEEITRLRAKRDIKIKQLVSEALDDISRIDKMHHDIDTQLSEDEDLRNRWIPKVKSTIKVGSKACESAKKEIANFLDSTLKNLVLYGGPFRSLVKSSLQSQSQDVVVKGCKEIVTDLPKLHEKDQPQDFIKSTWPSKYSMAFITCILLIFAVEEGNKMRDNSDLLNSDSLRNISFALFHMFVLVFCKCMFLIFLQFRPVLDSPLEFLLPCRKAFRLLIKLGYFTLYPGLIVVASQMFLYGLCRFYQMEVIIENTVQLISLLHSVWFVMLIRQPKIFKQSWRAAISTVLHHVEQVEDIVISKFIPVLLLLVICYEFCIKYNEDNSIFVREILIITALHIKLQLTTWKIK